MDTFLSRKVSIRNLYDGVANHPVPQDEAYGESEIVEEFQKGFKCADKVIRFSMVKVAN